MDSQENLNKKPIALFNVAVTTCSILLISFVLLFVAHFQANKYLENSINQIDNTLTYLTENKFTQLSSLLENLSHRGEQFVNDQTIRRYVSKIAKENGDITALIDPLKLHNQRTIDAKTAELAIELPLVQNSFKDFASFSNFKSGRIINKNAEPFIATTMMLPPLSEQQIINAKKTINESKAIFSTLRQLENSLEADLFLPIFSPDAGINSAPVGVLMLTKDLTSEIKELLKPSPLSHEGGTTRLIQKGENSSVIDPNIENKVKNIFNLPMFDKNNRIPFASRPSVNDKDKSVYSVGITDNEGNFCILQEVNTETATVEIKRTIQAIYGVAWIGIVATILATILVWWILLGFQRKKIAKNFKNLALQIDEQQQFIHSINTSISDFITLKDLDGKFIYTNKPFSIAVGYTPDQLLGMTIEDIFDQETAQKLQHTNKQVISSKKKSTITETINLQSEDYQFQISKVPYLDKDRNCIGIVEVYRDVTDMLRIQHKNEILHEQTIEALNATIKAIDPHLNGHTQLLSYLTEQVAKKLNLPENDKINLVTAANLSQIGKAFIPRDILTKPNQLNEAEHAAIQEHVNHALQILRETDVTEEILTIIHQMHEKTDGTGYPQQLKGDAINKSAKILGSLNVFCALIQPRAYRDSINFDSAFDILNKECHNYEKTTIEALGQLLCDEEIRTYLMQSIN